MRHYQKSSLAAALLALSTHAATGAAADAPTQSYVSVEQATETSSANITLPSGPGSALIVSPCAGCAPLTLRATSATTYYLQNHKVTLGDLKAAIGGHTVAVTVFSSVKNQELTRVIANVEAPAPTQTRAPVHAPTRK